MKPWIAAVLGLGAGILIVTGSGLFHEQISPNPHSYAAPKRAAALTSGSTLSANSCAAGSPGRAGHRIAYAGPVQ